MLIACSNAPLTGFFRDGYCKTCAEDAGSHTVCAVMTEDFLEYSRAQGNDLITPRPEYRFPGLKPGDRWCLCAGRWQEAADADCAPKVVLEACHERCLEIIDLEDLQEHAIPAE